MKQQTLAMAADQSESFERYRRPTRCDEFLADMDCFWPTRTTPGRVSARPQPPHIPPIKVARSVPKH